MTKLSRDEIKVRGIGRFFKSFKYSFEGLIYAYKNEQSLMIHFILSVTAIILGLLLGINKMEWIIIILAISVILIVELFNSAIEAVVDLVTLDFNNLAKIAKDCGSAATFVVSLAGVIVCLSIFIPYIIDAL